MFAALLLIAAVQDVPVPAPVPASVAGKPKKAPVICRPVRETVSRIGGGRECHTSAQWRMMGESVDGHELDRFNGDTRTTQNPGPR